MSSGQHNYLRKNQSKVLDNSKEYNWNNKDFHQKRKLFSSRQGNVIFESCIDFCTNSENKRNNNCIMSVKIFNNLKFETTKKNKELISNINSLETMHVICNEIEVDSFNNNYKNRWEIIK